ncbi:Rrf2 family transcriptional regulator [Anaerocolumna xylanovorans]|uniref:Transcriptional regulator, BadM/Rrf2 family n=1 Tax=Anaerocolumna xylanovorans DSM 12503 TaxID=1121345 RepID=A0A1M7YMP5_9FIRM|nr:Rrf2 family transcriptional regulator [Anaerocolumna xylanovorans]SHO53909.1 transcriptional regulator, BadM/Rrf2 family [Anaerocolumna xylanovorans DSM 12503]
MKLTRGIEQAVCIIALLSTQDYSIPVASEEIHKRLKGSLTYTKKIIRKLVVGKMVNSVSGNNGGFTLAKKTDEINLLDIVEALEGTIRTYPDSGLIDKVFEDKQVLANQGTIVMRNAFAKADMLYREALRAKTVSQLLEETLGSRPIGPINWNQADERRDLLIRKVMKNIHGND